MTKYQGAMSKGFDASWRDFQPGAAKPKKAARRSTATKARPRVLLPVDEQCRLAGIPVPVPEYRFCARRWRFDWAWPELMIAVEVEGGIWTQGRHTRGAGALGDMSKYNSAVIAGWRLLRVTPTQAANGEALDLVAPLLTPK